MSKMEILYFPDIVPLLLLQRKIKFRIKLMDTIFFTCNNDQTSKIRSWYYSSNKGDLTQRKDVSSLNMLHIYDRFCRISGRSNPTCARTIAIAYILDKDTSNLRRVSLTLDQLHREAKQTTGNLLKNICWLQYNISCGEAAMEHRFRVIYSLKCVTSENGCTETSTQIEFHLVDEMNPIQGSDGHIFHDSQYSDFCDDSSADYKLTHKELQALMLKIVNHVESSIVSDFMNGMRKRKVIQLVGEFVLDKSRQLWLSSLNRLVLGSDENVFDHLSVNEESSMLRTYLPSIKTSEIRQQTKALSPNKNERDDHKSLQHQVRCDEEEYATQIHGSINNLQQELQKAKACDIAFQNQIKKILPEIERTTKSRNLSDVVENEMEKSSSKKPQSAILDTCKATYIDMIKAEKELREANLRNCQLQSALTERGAHDRIIRDLEEECNNLRRQLEEERYDKYRSQKELQDRNFDLIEEERRTRDELDLLTTEIEEKTKHHNTSMDTLIGMTKVMEAEIQTQREYVKQIRKESYDELASQLKVRMNDVIVQAISESCFGISRAVASSDEVWKSKLTEINQEHSAEISKLHNEYRNEIRFKESQYRMQLEADRNESEKRFQMRLSESLKTAVEHKERQRQNDLKNETKRWEQVLSEVNAQISIEHQKDVLKKLQERDAFWNTKVQQQTLEHEKILGEKITELEEKITNITATHKNEMQSLVKHTQDAQTKAIENTIIEVKSNYEKMIKIKETELSQQLIAVETKAAHKIESETTKRVTEAVRLEALKHEKANAVVNQIAKDYEQKISVCYDEIDDLKLLMQKELGSKDEIIMELSKKLAKDVTNDKLTAEYEETINQLKNDHEDEIHKIRLKANDAITEEVQKTKAEADRILSQTVDELSEEHDEKLQSLEYEHGWLKTQLENAGTEILNLKNDLTKKDLDIGRLKELLNNELLRHCYHNLFMNSKALIKIRRLENVNNDLKQSVSEAHKLKREIESEFDAKYSALEKTKSSLEDRMNIISSTLLHFKREDIINCKMKSKDIAKVINQISEKIQFVEEKRRKALTTIENLEQAMHDVEKQLQDHAQTSALQKGKVNINHARKKRRLDEEYEQILCKIELHREEQSKIDEEFMRLKSEKHSSTDEMRILEKSLVELLVEQQKKLLSLSLR